MHRAILEFTPLAWTKMWLLVDYFDSEVAWAGVCERMADDPLRIVVTDILLHKQTVTGGTVRTDQQEYEEWLDDIAETNPDLFFKISMHGHSHYTMAPRPSGLDEALQDDISGQLSGDMFYVFLIVNRGRRMWAKIVDNKTETTYYSDQIMWRVCSDTFDSVEFFNEADSLIEEEPYHGGGEYYNESIEIV